MRLHYYTQLQNGRFKFTQAQRQHTRRDQLHVDRKSSQYLMASRKCQGPKRNKNSGAGTTLRHTEGKPCTPCVQCRHSTQIFLQACLPTHTYLLARTIQLYTESDRKFAYGLQHAVDKKVWYSDPNAAAPLQRVVVSARIQ